MQNAHFIRKLRQLVRRIDRLTATGVRADITARPIDGAEFGRIAEIASRKTTGTHNEKGKRTHEQTVF